MISFMKGRGKKILDTPNRKNASKIPHHHLNIFLMGIFLFIFLRLVKNAQMQGARNPKENRFQIVTDRCMPHRRKMRGGVATNKERLLATPPRR
jgi:hypothetical protein